MKLLLTKYIIVNLTFFVIFLSISLYNCIVFTILERSNSFQVVKKKMKNYKQEYFAEIRQEQKKNDEDVRIENLKYHIRMSEEIENEMKKEGQI